MNIVYMSYYCMYEDDIFVNEDYYNIYNISLFSYTYFNLNNKKVLSSWANTFIYLNKILNKN